LACILSLPNSLNYIFFGQWKFAFFSLGRPEYLEDSEVVSNRFQVIHLHFNFILSLKNITNIHLISISYIWTYAYIVLSLYPLTEKRRIWCLGAVSWLGAY